MECCFSLAFVAFLYQRMNESHTVFLVFCIQRKYNYFLSQKFEQI